MVSVTDELGKQVLKDVSRSFYLTLRLLPVPMRGATSLGYLLARTSDTLADTAAAPVEVRQECLDRFRREIMERGDFDRWPESMVNVVPDLRERHLLSRTTDLLKLLRSLPADEADLVREVLEIIISGQTLDLERFGHASERCPVTLRDDAELEDYAWRVAGSVGAFWTKLGFLTMGGGFSKSTEAELLEQGIAYGKGLQLVNVLRDFGEDFVNGRCYLPVDNPHDPTQLLRCHAQWLARAEEWLGEGERYAETLRSRRVRTATVLPALLARKTLGAMRGVSWAGLQTQIRIPRSEVYLSLVRACFF